MKCICPRVGWWDGRRVKKSELWGILIPRRPQPLIPVMRCVHCAILLNFSSHTAFISFKSLSLQVRQQYSLHLQEQFEHCAIRKINLPIQSSKFPFPLSKKLASRILRSWVEKKIFDGVAHIHSIAQISHWAVQHREREGRVLMARKMGNWDWGRVSQCHT